MKKIIIHHGFHPENKREYNGEHIYKVTNTKIMNNDGTTTNSLGIPEDVSGNVYYRLEHGAWIKNLGNEKYVTDWTGEERWGRVEVVEIDDKGEKISGETLGFMILRVDRSKGIL